jgi:hypothetical protein
MTGIEKLYSMQSFDDNGSLIVHHKPPYKEIFLAVGLLALGVAGIVIGMFMIYNKVGGDHLHGTFAFTSFWYVFLLNVCEWQSFKRVLCLLLS